MIMMIETIHLENKATEMIDVMADKIIAMDDVKDDSKTIQEFLELCEITKRSLVTEILADRVNGNFGFCGFDNIGDMYYAFIDEMNPLANVLADAYIEVIKEIRVMILEAKLIDYIVVKI